MEDPSWRAGAYNERMRLVCGVLCAMAATVGCGRLSFGDDTDVDAALGTDAIVDSAPLGPWSSARRISELSTPMSEQEPTTTQDGLELYFRRGSGVSADLYVAKRTAKTDPWSAPAPVSVLNSSSAEGTPALSIDGLTIWFTTDRIAGNYDIWYSTRATLASPWTAPQPESGINTLDPEFSPSVSADGLTMLVCVDNAGPEIHIATRTLPTAAWSAPQPITELDSIVEDGAPRFFGDREIYFHSQRSGGTGSYDLYRAARDGSTGPFTTIEELRELNSPTVDWDLWVSQDGRYIIWGSDRTGDHDLYEATR